MTCISEFQDSRYRYSHTTRRRGLSKVLLVQPNLKFTSYTNSRCPDLFIWTTDCNRRQPMRWLTFDYGPVFLSSLNGYYFFSLLARATRRRYVLPSLLYQIAILVMVCVSTCVTPGIAAIFCRNSDSGAKLLASHGPKSLNGTVIMSLKSKQAPQTNRLTVMSALTLLICPMYSSTTPAMASRDLLSDLSPTYLQRHSRQTRSNDILPFAMSTIWSAVVVVGRDGAARIVRVVDDTTHALVMVIDMDTKAMKTAFIQHIIMVTINDSSV
jgi:hypothetical protein